MYLQKYVQKFQFQYNGYINLDNLHTSFKIGLQFSSQLSPIITISRKGSATSAPIFTLYKLNFKTSEKNVQRFHSLLPVNRLFIALIPRLQI